MNNLDIKLRLDYVEMGFEGRENHPHEYMVGETLTVLEMRRYDSSTGERDMLFGDMQVFTCRRAEGLSPALVQVLDAEVSLVQAVEFE